MHQQLSHLDVQKSMVTYLNNDIFFIEANCKWYNEFLQCTPSLTELLANIIT